MTEELEQTCSFLPSKEDSEAEYYAKQYWSKTIRQCGDSYFRLGDGSSDSGTLYQYKNASTKVEKGYGGYGGYKLKIHSSAYRERNPVGGWTPWVKTNPYFDHM